MLKWIYATLVLGLFSEPMLAASPSDIIVGSACKNTTALGCPGSGKTNAFALFRGGMLVFISLIAGVSVIMIVFGGLRYVLSGGDTAGIRGAKDTILYALAGLAVAIFSFIIVSFVIGKIG